MFESGLKNIPNWYYQMSSFTVIHFLFCFSLEYPQNKANLYKYKLRFSILVFHNRRYFQFDNSNQIATTRLFKVFIIIGFRFGYGGVQYHDSVKFLSFPFLFRIKGIFTCNNWFKIKTNFKRIRLVVLCLERHNYFFCL